MAHLSAVETDVTVALVGRVETAGRAGGPGKKAGLHAAVANGAKGTAAGVRGRGNGTGAAALCPHVLLLLLLLSLQRAQIAAATVVVQLAA